MAGPIRIAILANGAQASREMNRTAATASKMAGKIKTAAKVGLVAAGAAAVKFGIDAVKAASDAEQSIGATEKVFGKFAKTVIKRSNEAATALGLSANEYRELSNVSGAMLKSSGMPLRKVTQLTDKLNKRAADLAATFGGSTREAVEAISSLLRGEANPIERYGVSIKQSDINARLAAKGLDKLEGAARKQAEQQARLKLLFDQTKDSAGQFADEASTLAGQQQRLSAEWENLKIKIGTALLPALTRLIEFIRSSVVPRIESLWNAFKPAFDVIGTVGRTIGGIIGKVREGNWSGAWNAAKTAASDAWDGEDGIRSKVVGVIRDKIMPRAVKAVENAKDGWGRAWKKLEEDPAGTYASIQRKTDQFGRNLAINLTLSSIRGSRGFMNAMDGLPGFMAGTMGRTYANARRIGSSLPGLFLTIGTGAALGFLRGISGLPGALVTVNNHIQVALFRMRAGVIGFFADASGWLWNAGWNIVGGLISGFSERIGNFYSMLSAVTARIPMLKGPPAKDKKLLYRNGRLIMHGLMRGFRDGWDKTQDQLKTITKRIADTINKAYKGASGKERTRYFREVMRFISPLTAALKRNAKAQDQVNKRLETARDRLKELRQASKEYAAQVKDSLIAAGSVVGLGADDDGTVTTKSMLDQLKDRANAVKRFGSLIRTLTKQGLNKTTLQQLLDAGVEGGLATAEAIAAGGKSAIKQVNSLTSQIAKEATSLGNSTAKTFYGAGIKAAEGLVRGLERQQKQLDKVADRLAKRLANQVKKALKIKSPSRVFQGIGDNVTKGLAIGLDDTYVRRKASTLAASLEKGFGQPALEAYLTAQSEAERRQRETVSVTLTAEQLSDLEQGRKIQMKIDAYKAAGGRVRAT